MRVGGFTPEQNHSLLNDALSVVHGVTGKFGVVEADLSGSLWAAEVHRQVGRAIAIASEALPDVDSIYVLERAQDILGEAIVKAGKALD